MAALAERDGRFLLVEEETPAGLRLNQPAGHLDPHESLLAAVSRETLEETAHRFQPTALVGIYRLPLAGDDAYLRFAFAGDVLGVEPGRALDHGIVRALWLPVDEIRNSRDRHRTPLVWRCVEDYLAGTRIALDLLREP